MLGRLKEVSETRYGLCAEDTCARVHGMGERCSGKLDVCFVSPTPVERHACESRHPVPMALAPWIPAFAGMTRGHKDRQYIYEMDSSGARRTSLYSRQSGITRVHSVFSCAKLAQQLWCAALGRVSRARLSYGPLSDTPTPGAGAVADRVSPTRSAAGYKDTGTRAIVRDYRG